MKVSYRLDVLVRVARLARDRATREYAAACRTARAAEVHARWLERRVDDMVAATHRADRFGAPCRPTELGRIDAHDAASWLRIDALRDAVHAARRRADAAATHAADCRAPLRDATRHSRLQESLKDAVVARCERDARRREARRSDAEALEVWLSGRLADGD